MINHAKWYVNVGKWAPTKEQWLKLTSSIAEQEVGRINNFVFQDDAKSAIIGRALIRRFISHAGGSKSNEVDLIRSQYGRPLICPEDRARRDSEPSWPKMIDFNVSHSGDFCVLAGIWARDRSPSMTVGVDVTKIVRKKTRAELDRFLELMSRREFLPPEWDLVERVPDERQKCINFTRLWCLKESFIKSKGLGLSFRLSRICFQPSEQHRYSLSTANLKNRILDDTRVLLDNQLADDWLFQETALDDEHLVAVGYNLDGVSRVDYSMLESLVDKLPFVEIQVQELCDCLTPLREQNEENWRVFSGRSIKNHPVH